MSNRAMYVAAVIPYFLEVEELYLNAITKAFNLADSMVDEEQNRDRNARNAERHERAMIEQMRLDSLAKKKKK
jgi:hypothetical protein